MVAKFQSPQWGSNSKVKAELIVPNNSKFQSPQWGSNSKVILSTTLQKVASFSPRNGEVILKTRTLSSFH